MIAQGLKDMLSEWDLAEEKLSAITTDNGANVVKAAALNGWIRQQCFGHRLHLAIENGLKDQRVTRAVRVCKNIVSAFSYSWKKKEGINEACILHILNSRVLAEEKDDVELTKTIKTSILRYLNEKYSDPITEELLDTASFVEPRFKATYISADNVPTIQEKVKTEMEKMSEAEVCRESQITETAEPTTSSAVAKKQNSYYCSSPSERVFCSGGNIVTCLRSCLKPEKVNMLVFLSKNLE
ncbi:zinc finger BED domain-containing protein 1-like, partial [Tachysurus ichikawai]